MKKHIYTEAEKTEITRLYPHCSTKEIARLFGISAASVYNLADRLGLKKSPEHVSQAKQVFQGVNTLINLAKTELEYRKFVNGMESD